VALNLGDVYFGFVARTSGLTKGVGEASKKVEQLAKKASEVSGKVAAMGAAFQAVGGALVAQAAQYDRGVAKEVDRVKNAYNSLAVEAGRTLLPVVRSVGDTLTKLTNAFRALSPETKESIANFVMLAAKITAIAGLTSKVAGLAGSFISLAASVAPMIAPLLAVVGIVSSLVLIGSVFYDAWEENLFGVRDVFTDVWQWISDTSTSVFNSFKPMLEALQGWFSKAFMFVKKQFADWAINFLGGIETIAKAIGVKLGGPGSFIDTLREMLAAFGEATISELGDGLVSSLDVSAGKAVKRAGDVLEKWKAKLMALMPKMGGGGELAKLTSIADQDKAAAKEHEDTWKAIKDKNAEMSKLLAAGITDGVKEFDDALQRAADAARNFGESMVSRALGMAGEAGRALSGALDGFRQAGLIGAIVGFASELEPVQQILGHVGEILQQLVDVLDPFFGIVNQLVGTVGTILTPVFSMLAAVLEPFLPVLQVVASIFAALSPLFVMLMEAVNLIVQPITQLVTVALKGFFEAVRFLGIAVLRIAKFFPDLWNGIVSAVSGLLRSIAKFDVAGAKPFAFLNDWANGVDKAKINVDGLAKAIMDLEGLTWEEAMQKAKASANFEKLNEKVRDVSESLTNLPQGFKVAAARFGAMEPVGGGVNPFDVMAGRSSGGVTLIVQGNVYGVDDLAAEIQAATARASYRVTGSPKSAAAIRQAGF
jgi:phage-related protein